MKRIRLDLFFFTNENYFFQRSLKEKAATVKFPYDEAAELNPKYVFNDSTLIIHMCLDCRRASSSLEMNTVDENNQQLGKCLFK